jgi:UDP-N-acetylmuramate dehydrogenase
LGGAAEFFAEPTSVAELVQLVQQSRQDGIAVRMLGGGSNVLVREAGVSGLVIHLSAAAFSQVTVDRDAVKAGAAAKLGHVISMSVGAGLAGLEQLVGIPGTLGGALRGNASTQKGYVGQWCSSVIVLTYEGEIETRGRDKLRFSHQQSNIDDLAILEAEFQLEREGAEELTKRLQKQWILKKAHEPMMGECCGCIFRDPMGDSAASTIEAAGFKGKEIGGAKVSERNANFIVTQAGTNSDDVISLIDEIRAGVSEHLGVELEVNLQIW